MIIAEDIAAARALAKQTVVKVEYNPRRKVPLYNGDEEIFTKAPDRFWELPENTPAEIFVFADAGCC